MQSGGKWNSFNSTRRDAVIHVNPDLSRGILREKDGNRFFLRLWPEPVFLRESTLNSWSDIEDVQDDFNLTALVEARDKTIKKLALSHPSLVASIVQRQQFIGGYELPLALQSLLRIQRRIEQREQLLSAIPPGTLGLVRHFPEAHFSLLKFFSEYPDGFELAETNPPLAFLLAIHGERFGASSSKSVHDLLRSKRAEILKNLGFAIASERVVRLMGKVKPWACRAGLLTGIRQVLSDTTVIERLRHLPEINFGCMAIAAEKKLFERVSNGILHEIVDDRKEDKRPDTALKLQSCLELEEQRRLVRLPAIFHTRNGIQRLLVAEAEHLTPEEIDALGLTFYPSPLPDTPGIQALRTPEDVYEEGCEQGNCVWSLLPRLVTGKLFLYRVLAPERATLALKYSKGGLCIDELEAAWNQPVSIETEQVVQRWLDEMRLGDNGQPDELFDDSVGW